MNLLLVKVLFTHVSGLTQCSAATTKAAPAAPLPLPGGPAPGATGASGPAATPGKGHNTERYRRLIPYMTYYVAQGLTQGMNLQRPGQSGSSLGAGQLQPVHNSLESYSPHPVR